MLVFKAYRKSPALTQETTPSQRRITRILSEAQQAAAREFGSKLTQVADALERGRIDRIAAMLPTEPWLEAQDALASELLGELLDAGSRVTLPAIEKASVNFSFDRTRPESAQWARTEAGSLINQITGQQLGVIRELVASAALGEMDSAEVARTLRGSIGLTTQQAGWVANHYERAFSSAIRDGATTARARDMAARSSDRYQSSVHRYRANTIARTETMRAASEGRMQAWNQGLTDGFINPLWQKEWVAESDACDICLGLDETRVPVKGQFPFGEPPAHPNCRCDVILIPSKVDPSGGGGGLLDTLALLPFEDIAFQFIPTPSIEDVRQWREAYRIASQEQGDRRSFQEWFNDVIEPDITAYASDGTFEEPSGQGFLNFDDNNFIDWDPYEDNFFKHVADAGDLVDDETIEILEFYNDEGYLDMNGRLRLPVDPFSVPDELDYKIQTLTELILDAPRTSADLRVWRGMGWVRELQDIEPGSIWVHSNFMSTSANPEIIEEFFSETVLRINVPRGAPAVALLQAGEEEVLFAPGMKLRLIKIVEEVVDGLNDDEPVIVYYMEMVL